MIIKNILYVKLINSPCHKPDDYETMGILQLVNKKNDLPITKEDEKVIT